MNLSKLDKKRILLKIGSNVLTKETNQISRGKLEDIARQIASLKDEYEFTLKLRIKYHLYKNTFSLKNESCSYMENIKDQHICSLQT